MHSSLNIGLSSHGSTRDAILYWRSEYKSEVVINEQWLFEEAILMHSTDLFDTFGYKMKLRIDIRLRQMFSVNRNGQKIL